MIQSRAQDGNVPAEFIDDKTLDHLPLLRLQQHQGACQAGKNAAAVDVADQQNGCIHQLRQTHIYNIILLEIDFRRTACTLQHDDVVLLIQLAVCLHDVGDHLFFAFIIFARRQVAQHLAVDDDLRAGVVGGFEQDGVHQNRRFDTGCLRLHHLCASHFQPFLGDEGVERHILRFKRSDPIAVLMKDAAEGSCQIAFSGIGHRPLHHDCFCH